MLRKEEEEEEEEEEEGEKRRQNWRYRTVAGLNHSKFYSNFETIFASRITR